MRLRFPAVLMLVVVTGAAYAAETTPGPDALAQAALQIEQGRVLVSGAALGLSMGDVDLQSDRVCDYTFSSAPTDWLVRSGEWNATNRWTCSPQWSWYGGYSPAGLAAMWNKRQFVGDITVELHCAFKMRANRDPTYLHPNDLNISICGDGANLDSGYSFIVGGDNNRWTRIMRGDRVIAESRDPKALWPIYENGQPSTYEWHRKWWQLRVRKSGPKLQVYLDENLVLEGTDPDPLPGGRVALWVLKNDMIMPRVKVYYASEKLPRDPMPATLSPLLATTAVAEPQAVLSCTTHPSIQNDFENALGAIATRDEDQGAVCSLVPDDPAGAGHCLQLTNRAAGGHFGVNLITPQFDARQLSRLSFDYRLTPEAKVNLYLTCAGKHYEIVFGGSRTPADGREVLGEIGAVATDGKWRHADFDLLGALRESLGAGASMACSDLWAGNLSNEGYLLAGFGGNRAGTTWSMDNFFAGQPRGATLELALTPKSGVEVAGYAVAVDDKPHGAAPAAANCPDGKFAQDLAAEGTLYAHVRPVLKDGKPGAVMNYAFGVDRSAPTAKLLDPAEGTSLTDQPVRLAVHDLGGSGPDLATLKLSLGQAELTAASPGVVYDPLKSELGLDPRALGLSLQDGQRVALTLTALSDRAGNALAAPQKWDLGLHVSTDKTPPVAPRLKLGAGYLLDDDFERDLGQWATYGDGGAVLTRDASTAHSGKYSLKLYCPMPGRRFGAYVLQQPFDAGKNRIVSFAYKCDDRLRADLAVYVNGDWKQIHFMDNDSELGVIGSVPDVQPDDQWHTTSFNLYDMLRAEDPQAPTFMVRQFVIADWGWAGNRAGAVYHLDDFQIVPVVSGATPLRLAWASPDVSGLAGAAYKLDALVTAIVPETLNAPGAEADVSLAGQTDTWLSVRTQDKAGNWSDVTRRRLLVDSEAPTAQALAPAAEQKHAVSQIEIGLADKGLAGVDPASIRLKVAGAEYAMDGNVLRFLPKTGKLVWNCEEVRPNPVVFADKSQVAVQLVTAADYAGNAVPQVLAWNWTMDYSQDKAAPPVREIHSTTHPTLLTQTFEDGATTWTTWDGANGAQVEVDAADGSGSKASVKLTNQRAGGHMGALITAEPYDCEKYPIIAFDYKIPAATKLALTVTMRDKTQAITLNDAATDVIGRVPGIIADGKWRHAQVEIMPMLRRQFTQGPLVVERIVISDRNTMDNAAGAVAHLDNFVIGQIGKYPPVLRWRATDTTGVKGYSFVLDQNSATVPDETIEGPEVAKSFDAMAGGIWYFHIRAQDGAANWGATTTYALLHLKAE